MEIIKQIMRNKNNLVSGIIGALIVIAIVVLFIAFIAPIDYAPVYLLNPEKALSYNNAVVIDSIKCAHIEVLKDLESKGVLLNPCEYTSHITEYYNTLISLLLGLFGLFTIVTMYSINITSKKEIDEIKTDITNHKEKINTELKQSIVKSLSELMRDSISFKETCINALYGHLEDEVLTHKDGESIDNRIQELERNVKRLLEMYDKLEENQSYSQEIE